jgi:hypothetical protein
LAVAEKEETSVSDSYLGATESGLLGAPLARRLGAYSDQRRLFPHQGTLQLTPRVLVLGGWRVIRREEVASVRLTFTRAYRRSQPVGAVAPGLVQHGGARSMRRRLIAALILAILVVGGVSGCHFHVTVHSGPAPRILPAGG